MGRKNPRPKIAEFNGLSSKIQRRKGGGEERFECGYLITPPQAVPEKKNSQKGGKRGGSKKSKMLYLKGGSKRSVTRKTIGIIISQKNAKGQKGACRRR